SRGRSDQLLLLLGWQGGLEIDKVLSLRCGDVEEGLRTGERPLKLSFSGRKKMHRSYYTFIGRDGIEALRAWKGRWVEVMGRDPAAEEFVLIGNEGRPMDYQWISERLKQTVKQLAGQGLVRTWELPIIAMSSANVYLAFSFSYGCENGQTSWFSSHTDSNHLNRNLGSCVCSTRTCRIW